MAPRNSACVAGIINKAYYPQVLYDYDRANAYFNQIHSGVSEKDLSFTDKAVFGIKQSTVLKIGGLPKTSVLSSVQHVKE